MSQKNQIDPDDKRTGHIYDGIEELDYPPPNWFRALFYITIAFGVIYFFYYTIGDGPTLTQEYQKAKNAEEYAQYERRATSGGAKSLSEGELIALVRSPERKAAGAASFQTKCASCHGGAGQGGIGPNLTDENWLHGAKMTEILATITQGVPDKGMPAWGQVLGTEEIQSLTVFIRSLLGTKPAGAKAPQGALVKAEP